MTSLVAAPIWFAVGIGIAAGRVMWLGAHPNAWSIELVAVPLAIGGVIQVLMGAWSHLIPAIGPGDAAAHARQRTALGRWNRRRIATLNTGTAILYVGTLAGAPPLGLVGTVLIAASVLAALWLLGRACYAGLRGGGVTPIQSIGA